MRNILAALFLCSLSAVPSIASDSAACQASAQSLQKLNRIVDGMATLFVNDDMIEAAENSDPENQQYFINVIQARQKAAIYLADVLHTQMILQEKFEECSNG